MSRPVGYVLAGGRSSRFGTDKARAVVGGLPLVARVALRIAPRVDGVTVVADRADKFADLGLRTIADPIPGLGPIGGLLGALEDAPRGPVFVVSCDFVAFEPRWIDRLRAAWRSGDSAVAFRTPRGWEPTFALWSPALVPAVREAIDRGERALRRLLDRCAGRPVPPPRDWDRAVQVNTRRALSAWLDRTGAGPGAFL
ncbi:MAG: molybdenum cofactor guanylyltransferase [Acidobacteria bacterium]|nr:MAG: molybdenum cofactor guanylyltransferase [Acidobacteriota bacterium]